MKLDSARDILFQQKNNGFTVMNLLEFILLTVMPPVIGYLFYPLDPFMLRARFPILVIPPLLIALRYGLALGMANFFIILCCITGAYFNGTLEVGHYPAHLLFGIMVITLITGEMTDMSLARRRYMQAQNKFINMRFKEFTSAYHIMKVSHDQLKEQLANTRFSLREALQTVKEKLQEQYRQGNRGLNAQVGNELLSILNYFCSAQIAGVYATGKAGAIEPKPVATQGNIGDLKAGDALVRSALSEGTMVSVLPEMHTYKSPEELETDLLVVVPIKDVSGYLWGIIVVEEMHFTAFQEENLNLMQLIVSYSGDLLSRADCIFYSEDDRQAFLSELEYSWCMADKLGIISSIVCITFEKEVPADDIFRAVSCRIRSSDHAWLTRDAHGNPVICLMMMLMTEAEYFDFQKSLDLYFKDRLGRSLTEFGGIYYHLEVTPKLHFSEYVEFLSDMVPLSQPQTTPAIAVAGLSRMLCFG